MDLVDTRLQIGVKLEDSITFKLGSPYTLNGVRVLANIKYRTKSSMLYLTHGNYCPA